MRAAARRVTQGVRAARSGFHALFVPDNDPASGSPLLIASSACDPRPPALVGRWLELAIFGYSAAFNAVATMNFAPMTNVSAQLLSTDIAGVDWLY